MRQITNFADARLLMGCVYCVRAEETREHVPPKVHLDLPYPENLYVVGACLPCNNGFSKDEEYVACLIECVVAGSTDPQLIRRPSITSILKRSPALRKRIELARREAETGVSFEPEAERVKRVLMKLAAGHAAYELAQECRTEEVSVWWHPIHLLTPEQRESFDAPDVVTLFGEIGSRLMQRLKAAEIVITTESGSREAHQVILNDWIEVQVGRYRYHTSDEGDGVSIRIVIGEYLAAEVRWDPYA